MSSFKSSILITHKNQKAELRVVQHEKSEEYRMRVYGYQLWLNASEYSFTVGSVGCRFLDRCGDSLGVESSFKDTCLSTRSGFEQ